jgi:hypothetical protein
MAPDTNWQGLLNYKQKVEPKPCISDEKAQKKGVIGAVKKFFKKMKKEKKPETEGAFEMADQLQWPMWPKIVQVNKTDIYLLGGNNTTIATQMTNAYEVLAHNFKIDLDPQVLADPSRKLVVHRKKSMLEPRQAFGLCVVNNFIYVTGGVRNPSGYTKTTDRYDVINDTW